MLEDNLEENQPEEIFEKDNYTEPNFVNQIDDIISKYKSQLEQLKTNSNPNNIEHTIETIPIISPSTLQSKTLSSLM